MDSGAGEQAGGSMTRYEGSLAQAAEKKRQAERQTIKTGFTADGQVIPPKAIAAAVSPVRASMPWLIIGGAGALWLLWRVMRRG